MGLPVVGKGGMKLQEFGFQKSESSCFFNFSRICFCSSHFFEFYWGSLFFGMEPCPPKKIVSFLLTLNFPRKNTTSTAPETAITARTTNTNTIICCLVNPQDQNTTNIAPKIKYTHNKQRNHTTPKTISALTPKPRNLLLPRKYGQRIHAIFLKFTVTFTRPILPMVPMIPGGRSGAPNFAKKWAELGEILR